MRVALAILLTAFASSTAAAEIWPRWRGADGNGISTANALPLAWSPSKNVVWKIELKGEGSSSPICGQRHIFLTAAFDEGTRRAVMCLDPRDGKTLWSRDIEDKNPELASALTGHAAATPAIDDRHVVAMFGNAGAVCYGFDGDLMWHRTFGEFDSELGLATSPVIVGSRVVLVCDHDGSRFKTFDSFMIALDLETGNTVWKTERPGLYRSWSTPIVVPVADDKHEIVVNAQDELRGYDAATGGLNWSVRGMTGWVTPSPVFGKGLIFACSGKDGPTMAVRPGGKGDVSATHVAWSEKQGAPYVCSPVLYRGLLYVHNEQGILSCYRAKTGELCYRTRLEGKFVSSPIAGHGHVYATNDQGTTYVVKAGDTFQLRSQNSLDEECLASPGVFDGDLLIRTAKHLYRVQECKKPLDTSNP